MAKQSAAVGGHPSAYARQFEIQKKKREKDNEWHLMSQLKAPRALQ